MGAEDQWWTIRVHQVGVSIPVRTASVMGLTNMREARDAFRAHYERDYYVVTAVPYSQKSPSVGEIRAMRDRAVTLRNATLVSALVEGKRALVRSIHDPSV